MMFLLHDPFVTFDKHHGDIEKVVDPPLIAKIITRPGGKPVLLDLFCPLCSKTHGLCGAISIEN